MRKTIWKSGCVLLLLGILLLSLAHGAAEEAVTPFFRFDLDSADAWQKPLSNVRYLTKGEWSLKPFSAEKCKRYGIDTEARPSEKGLDTLNISGSAEFSEKQFRELAAKLRALAGDRQIWIVDCRLESHALLNGISVSWYGDHNRANQGMTLAEAEADEARRFGGLEGSEITVYTAKNNRPENPQALAVQSVMTEKELVESEGFHYLRLAANDHIWPEEEAIESFILFVEELDRTAGPEGVWLHFHCQAGLSRTGIFMEIYDMIRNPDVSCEDILLRHAMMGSSYFSSDNRKNEPTDRGRRIRQVYAYLHSNRQETGTWREWLGK